MKNKLQVPKENRAKIALENGSVFAGLSFGAMGTTSGEIVFNTSITGYQEISTDPSYKGQIVTMTYPLIGNYGINSEDVESRRPYVEGFVVKECSRITSNWRSEKSLHDYFKENNIVGIEGVDTRAITRLIRLKGAMRAVISSENLDDESLVQKAKASPELMGLDLVKDVTCDRIYHWNRTGKYRVVAIDCGIKYNILRELKKKGCRITVVPASTDIKKISSMKPDGLFVSNGPGDPDPVKYVIETLKYFIGKLPIFGICLGHQLLGLALGGERYKLKFGHHGGNHPVKDLKTGRVSISVQNHIYCVDIDTLNKDDIEITHINLNDNTLEGMRHKSLPIFSVQFHPECSPGPHDTKYLFNEFIDMMEKHRAKKR